MCSSALSLHQLKRWRWSSSRILVVVVVMVAVGGSSAWSSVALLVPLASQQYSKFNDMSIRTDPFATTFCVSSSNPQRRRWPMVVRRHQMSSTTTDNNLDSESDESVVELGGNRLHTPPDPSRSPGWSVTDNWNRLSQSDHINYQYNNNLNHQEDEDGSSSSTMLLSSIDQATLAALRMQNFGMSSSLPTPLTAEDQWLQKSIEQILSDEPVHLHNGSTSQNIDALENTKQWSDDMGNEIALLVRCNEQAASNWISQNTGIPRRSSGSIHDDVQQLVTYKLDHHHPSNLNNHIGYWKATTFLQQAVRHIFQTHAQVVGMDDTLVSNGNKWDANAAASWMTQSLQGTADGMIGPHDKRVTETLATYGRDGYMFEADLLRLYITASTGSPGNTNKDMPQWTTTAQLERFCGPEIEAVWRDIRNHGIITPSELESRINLASIQKQSSASFDDPTATLLDECEILDDYDGNLSVESSTMSDRQGRSSHERLDLYRNVPIWMRDGDFVFIDEQSCIGCMQCTSAAPGSFQMLEQSGRARTFCQRKSPDVATAVSACPVDCMHFVSFDELKELEIARDVGVADDHRHFGHTTERGYIAPTPLHVSRRDSDANHKSSFYHFIQDKCCKSTNCPQRGCYDCPKFNPGSNPYFQAKLMKATHIRAEYFQSTGTADAFRKVADL